MGETAQQQTRAAIPAVASLREDPERIEQMWAMRPDERVAAARGTVHARRDAALGLTPAERSRAGRRRLVVHQRVPGGLVRDLGPGRHVALVGGGRRRHVEPEESVMPLRATQAIGTGDGWDVTDSGLYVPDWAELDDARPGSVIENPDRQPVGIDLLGRW